MALRGVEPMSPTSTVVWEDVTAAQITEEVLIVLGPSEVDAVFVNVSMVEQTPPYEERRRHLQDDSMMVLTIDFAVSMFIQTTSQDLNLDQFVGGAFNSPNDRESYLGELQSSGDPAFEEANAVVVAVPVEPTPAPTNGPSSDDDTPVGLIAGLAVGGGFLVALAGLYVYKRGQPVPVASPSVAGSASRELKEVDDSKDVEQEIASDSYHSVSQADAEAGEVSTLGDMSLPTDAGESLGTAPEGQMAYDYEKELQATPIPATPTSLLDSSAALTDDDQMAQQYVAVDQFEVQAPRGMLGLVLESTPDGVPTVSAIKSSSPLVTQVRVGDQLLSVDGNDVTVMLSSDVSTLIASKKDNPVRTFVFARPQGGARTFDESDMSSAGAFTEAASVVSGATGQFSASQGPPGSMMS